MQKDEIPDARVVEVQLVLDMDRRVVGAVVLVKALPVENVVIHIAEELVVALRHLFEDELVAEHGVTEAVTIARVEARLRAAPLAKVVANMHAN